MTVKKRGKLQWNQKNLFLVTNRKKKVDKFRRQGSRGTAADVQRNKGKTARNGEKS